MRNLGALWQAYQADRYNDWKYEKRIIVDNEIYTEVEIYSFTKQGGLILDDFTIGMCAAMRLDVVLRPKSAEFYSPIPKNARVELQIRIIGNLGDTQWITFGTYFIDYRKQENNRLSLECYDAMLYAEQEFAKEGEVLPDFPMPSEVALQYIADAIGVELDSRNIISNDFYIPYTNKLTMREVLSFIASAHGGNFCITDDNRLRLVVPKNDTPLFTVSQGDIKKSTDSGNKYIDKLYMVYSDDGDFFEVGAGDTSLEIFNLFANEPDAERAYSVVSAYEYNATEITSADIDPALELGDSISVDGTQINLFSVRWTTRMYCDISVPTIGDTSREFGFDGSLNSAISRRVALDGKYYGVSISRQYGIKILREDGISATTINSDTWEAVFDGIKRLYFDMETGEFIFNGRLAADVLEAISGIITPYIYSENGAIVNAIVRRLRTDLSKPFRYLQGDTSDVHWQDIGDTPEASGRYFRVSYAQPNKPPVQFTISSVEGLSEVLLWWYNGIPGGSMTTNPDYAIPVDGTDPVPVMAYQYETGTVNKKELKRTPQGWWGVFDQYGIGVDASERGAGLIEKDAKYWQFIMKQGYGNEIGGIRISVEDGVELYNRDKGVWEYPSGGGGLDWDALDISKNGDWFAVTAGSVVAGFDTPRDESGRIISVDGGGKNRPVKYV